MARSALYDDFLHFVKAKRLFEPGERVLAAVSGGPDSVALLDLLVRLRDRGEVGLAACHLDHQLRGADSQADARFAAELCAERGVPCQTARRDVAALAERQGAGVEAAARRARYEFFAQAAARLSCTKVATAHTMSDNAETILQRLVEGAGPAGLSGIPLARPLAGPSAVTVVRPLLFATRERIEEYLGERAIASRLDRTNLEPLYLRNRLRLEILPALKEINPSVEEAVSRTGESIAALMDFIEDAVREAESAIVRGGGGGERVLHVAPLCAAHPAVAGEVLRRALLDAGVDGRRLSSAHIEAIIALARAQSPSGEIALPGDLVARRQYEHVIIAPAEAKAALAGAGTPDFEIALGVPGEAPLPGGARITARPLDEFDLAEFTRSKTPAEEVIDADAVIGGLAVRFPRGGDRFRPLGAPGVRKLQDFFTDAKVPRRARSRTPLVTDDDGIVWVAPHRIADRVKVTGATRRFIILRLES